MERCCVRAPEYLGCYTLPYRVESGEQVRFEGGLLRVFAPTIKGSQEKRIYRPLA